MTRKLHTLRLADELDNPQQFYPGSFTAPQRANALLLRLCHEAAIELRRLQILLATRERVPLEKEE